MRSKVWRAGALFGMTALAGLSPGGVWAQTVPAAADPAQGSEVVVTGSRLASAAINAQQPIQVLTSETLELRGDTRLADALDRIPALQNSLSAAQAGNAGGSPQAPTLDLRGLGDNRTLVLVDGRRHVAGVAGSAAVDISSIPTGLIERVDVLTGGASAIYGSDAVTGVVNFILKHDFEGAQLDLESRVSDVGDGENYYGSLVAGHNFGGGKGNVELGVQAESQATVRFGRRDNFRGNNAADDESNPLLFFQQGDPLPAGASYGDRILSSGSAQYSGTSASLVTRAQGATSRAFINDPRFTISAPGGLIGINAYGGYYAQAASDFLTVVDLDKNGIPDCEQSRNGLSGYGCFVGLGNGQVRPFRDGVFAGSANGSGGDGIGQTFDSQSLIPSERSVNLNLLAHYDVNSHFKPYFEGKVAYSESVNYNPYNSFDDTIPISIENPFIPAALRDAVNKEYAAQVAADPSLASIPPQVTIARDNIDIYDPTIKQDRRTYRGVIGAKGDIGWGFSYDAYFNYGRTEQRATSAIRLEDRYFAAIDAVTDPKTGQPTCRSNLDPTALPPESALEPDFPGTIPAFNTFTPGANSGCSPLNLFGVGQSSAAALKFQRYIATDRSTIEQKVVSGAIVGDSGRFFSLPGGPIGIAFGGEYREEASDFQPDPYTVAGYGFQFQSTLPVAGSFDVKEVFAEISLPLLSHVPFADTLAITAAGRVGDYSTVGTQGTYKVDAVWAPVRDIRFRGGYAETVRAPNIGELYTPLTSAVFRPIDPCDQSNITSGSAPANRAKNCLADGLPTTYVDPLTARFPGVSGGNVNLGAETSTSYTAGFVVRPRWVPRLTISIDYWNIRIENAIAAVSAQDIVDSCYDAPDLNNQYCGLFTRNRNAASPTYLGFTFLKQTQLNYAALRASGIDFSFAYALMPEDYGIHGLGRFDLAISGTNLETRDDYPFVANVNQANPVLKELNFPRWAFNTQVAWTLGPVTLSWLSNYQTEQALPGVEIENAATFTPALADDVWIHDVSVRWQVRPKITVIAGCNNLTDVDPFLGSFNTPVSPIGRTFFLRLSAKL